MKPKRCVVLGGSGFIGRHLMAGLVDAGHSVRCFSRSAPRDCALNSTQLDAVQWFRGDFERREDLAEALQDCDVCFHLVSSTLPHPSNLDMAGDVMSNLRGTILMLEECVKAGVQKVIFASSGGTVYGSPLYSPLDEAHPNNPTCSYGVTKLAIEKYLEIFRNLKGLDHAVLRIANPYGRYQRINSGQGAIAVFAGKALRGEPIEIWGSGEASRDFIHVGDVVKAFLACMENASNERVFNIGSGRGVTLNALLSMISDSIGRPLSVNYKPSRGFDVPLNVLNCNRAQIHLGWQPATSLSAGIEDFLRWARTTNAQ